MKVSFGGFGLEAYSTAYGAKSQLAVIEVRAPPTGAGFKVQDALLAQTKVAAGQN